MLGKVNYYSWSSKMISYIKYNYLNIMIVSGIIIHLTKMESQRMAQFTVPLIGDLWEMLHLRFLPLAKKKPRSRSLGHSL